MGLHSFVNRPIMATAINLSLLVIGLLGFQNLELRHTPQQAKNDFQISTEYPGANSATVEEKVTKPLEDALSGLDGLKRISAISEDGGSEIHVRFNPTLDPQKTKSDLRDRILAMQSSLPDTAKRPIIYERLENGAQILHLSFQDETRSVAELTDFLRRHIEERLRLIEGVARIGWFGDQLYEVSIEVDPARLSEHQVTPSDILTVLRNEKAFAAGGHIDTAAGRQTVVLSTALASPDAFGHLTVKTHATGRVTIEDVADVRVTAKPTDLVVQVNDHFPVGFSVEAKPHANPITVVKHVKRFLKELTPTLPSTLHVSILLDATGSFDASLQELKHTLWEAGLLVALIITMSLASFRAALLPMITIPLCLIGTFACLWLMGSSINPITLLALVLAIGLVVDDAIVVVENIHRHMESGMSALTAAHKSIKEISFAVMVMTITLAAVYLPLAFQTDASAPLFKEFAWTLAGSVLISGFVALTLIPALGGHFLKHATAQRAQPAWIAYCLQKIPFAAALNWNPLQNRYRILLTTALQHPVKVCLAALLIALLGIVGFKLLPSELTPLEDQNLLTGSITSKNYVPKNVKQDWFQAIRRVIQDAVPEGKDLVLGEWRCHAFWWLPLQPRADRSASSVEIAKRLTPLLAAIPGPEIFVNMNEGGSLEEEEALKLILYHTGEHSTLVAAAKKLVQAIKQRSDLFQNAFSGHMAEKPRLKITVDRALASELGVSIHAIEDTLYTFLSGQKATDFYFSGVSYPVTVRARESQRSEWQAINSFFVTGREGQWIPLGSLVSMQETQEPTQLKHYERMRGLSISVLLTPNASLDQAMQVLEPIIKAHLPADAQFRFSGKAEKYREARNALLITFGLSLVFIYLVLAALFESFVDPFTVLLTVPLSVTGAVWAIHAIGGSNNVYTAIGLVTLVGLITKHGILITDFANRLQAEGQPLLEAVVNAATTRLRPVLMTTLAMMFGALPLVHSVGDGAMARHHIGWVIIGGMASGTVFSLFVIPVVHSLMGRLSRPRVPTDHA